MKSSFNFVHNLGLLPLILMIVIAGVVFSFMYFIFFAGSPRIEVVLPPALESSSEIAALPFDELVGVVSDQKFRALENRSGMATIGKSGRLNPFIDYRNGNPK